MEMNPCEPHNSVTTPYSTLYLCTHIAHHMPWHMLPSFWLGWLRPSRFGSAGNAAVLKPLSSPLPSPLSPPPASLPSLPHTRCTDLHGVDDHAGRVVELAAAGVAGKVALALVLQQNLLLL